METMFGKMMEGCMKGMSEEDMKAIREKMMAFCGSKMEALSACFSKSCSTADQTCCDKSVQP